MTAVPEPDVERSTATGRAPSVHFLHFPFSAAQARKFRASGVRVVRGLAHESVVHMATLPEAVRQALCVEFD